MSCRDDALFEAVRGYVNACEEIKTEIATGDERYPSLLQRAMDDVKQAKTAGKYEVDVAHTTHLADDDEDDDTEVYMMHGVADAMAAAGYEVEVDFEGNVSWVRVRWEKSHDE